MKVLIVTSEWPTLEHPEWATFVVQQVKCLRAAGVQVDVFAFRGLKNPLRYLQAWIHLRKQHDLSKYDLIHAQYGQSGLIALPCPIPLVITFHGSDLQGIVGKNGRYTLAGKGLQWLSRRISRQATAIIVVSRRLKYLLPSNIPVHIIPGGVDTTRFCPQDRIESRKKLNLPDEKRLVLFPASPNDPVKRYPLALAAINQLKKSSTFNIQLVTLNAVPHEKVPLYLNACDVLLVTSLHEGSPTVVKEALACNLPVVSVDVGDVRERISSIEGCVLCQDDTPETIAAGLEIVLQSGKKIHGRETVLALDQHLVTKQIIAVYHQVLSGS